MFVLNPLFAQCVSSAESGQKWEETSYEKEIKKNFSSRIGSYVKKMVGL